jgi:hypothetical protein
LGLAINAAGVIRLKGDQDTWMQFISSVLLVAQAQGSRDKSVSVATDTNTTEPDWWSE